MENDPSSENQPLIPPVPGTWAAAAMSNFSRQAKPKSSEKSKNAPKATDELFDNIFNTALSKDGADPAEIRQNYAASKAKKDAAFLASLRAKAEQAAAERKRDQKP